MSDAEATERQRLEDRMIKWMRDVKADNADRFDSLDAGIEKISSNLDKAMNGNGSPGVKPRLLVIEVWMKRKIAHARLWYAATVGGVIGLPFYLARNPIGDWIASLL